MLRPCDRDKKCDCAIEGRQLQDMSLQQSSATGLLLQPLHRSPATRTHLHPELQQRSTGCSDRSQPYMRGHMRDDATVTPHHHARPHSLAAPEEALGVTELTEDTELIKCFFKLLGFTTEPFFFHTNSKSILKCSRVGPTQDLRERKQKRIPEN